MSTDQEVLYYRVARAEAEQGPIGLRELERLVRRNTLSRDTEVRREGSSAWIRLGRFMNLPDSKLPGGQEPSLHEMASLIDAIVIDAGGPVEQLRAPTVER
ncbi:MAG: DUF4339 domain-containing protein, partial [Planctomycetaceae bacterium]